MGRHLVLTRPKICTDRLVLVPARPSDAPAFIALWGDPEVYRYLWDGVAPRADVVAAELAKSDRSFQDRSGGLFKLHLDGEMVGFAGIEPAFWDESEVELMYGLRPIRWGQGFATEAAGAVLQWGFEDLSHERICAAVDMPNEASIRVLENVGMRYEREEEVNGLPTRFYSIERAR